MARRFDRRSFLKRAGSSAFFLLAGLAGGQLLTSRTARAQATPPDATRPPAILPPAGVGVLPSCSPPGSYCNLDGVSNPNGCQGANCYRHLYNGTVVSCTLYYQYYAAGCWTATVSNGYWTCCDCQCYTSAGTPTNTCGCAQFSGTPWRGTD